MTRDLIIGMAGSGGDGIVSAGESLIAACAAEGYHAIMTKSFGSQIRGGESSCRVRLAIDPVLNPGGALDVAVALNWEDFLKFGAELPVGGETVVIYDSATGVPPEKVPLTGISPSEVFAVPIGEMARKATGTDKAKNTVVLGLLSGWFGIVRDGVMKGMRKKLAKKGAEVLEANERAFQAGIDYAAAHPLRTSRTMEKPARPGVKLLTDGNDICAAAAIFSGCQFFGGYPITPSTEVMQLLTREIWKYGGAVLQAEDEIAGIGAALGASFAGKKSMTATSGPGMSLKTEVLGLASIAELPLVIVNVQRGGPSTGMPTKSEQSDLFQAVFSGHGDVVRPVLAPTTVSDTFDVTVEAFNLAEKYQTPVIVLSDQEIAQRKEVIDPIDTSRFTVVDRLRPNDAELEDYARFRLTDSGVSPISHPGLEGGNYLGAGIEHNEQGDPTASGSMHAKMTAKRFRKLDPLRERTDLFRIEGDPEAPLALISWGSTAGVCREALQLARAERLKVKLLVPYLLHPIAEGVYRRFFESVKAGLVVEQSYQGQLYRLLRTQLDLPKGLRPFCRTGANPFRPREVVDTLREAVLSLQRSVEDARQPQE
ncbi:MAG TPA: 2-oxoacid:acceptor oxidoreductase subunit alpha [Myxococcales bacterium]|jgi:2-oxoglutarate ferredoxin oxidoreductase subunit alpha|nr:2-oxoacid:acceptor oxidoreductase subunit alpha [Myxococcales bacterium]